MGRKPAAKTAAARKAAAKAAAKAASKAVAKAVAKGALKPAPKPAAEPSDDDSHSSTTHEADGVEQPPTERELYLLERLRKAEQELELYDQHHAHDAHHAHDDDVSAVRLPPPKRRYDGTAFDHDAYAKRRRGTGVLQGCPTRLLPGLSRDAATRFVTECEDRYGPAVWTDLPAVVRRDLHDAADEIDAYDVFDAYTRTSTRHTRHLDAPSHTRRPDLAAEAGPVHDPHPYLLPENWPRTWTRSFWDNFVEAMQHQKLYAFPKNAALRVERDDVLYKLREHWALRAPGTDKAWSEQADKRFMQVLMRLKADYEARSRHARLTMQRAQDTDALPAALQATWRRFTADWKKDQPKSREPGKGAADKPRMQCPAGACRQHWAGRCKKSAAECRYRHVSPQKE